MALSNKHRYMRVKDMAGRHGQEAIEWAFQSMLSAGPFVSSYQNAALAGIRWRPAARERDGNLMIRCVTAANMAVRRPIPLDSGHVAARLVRDTESTYAIKGETTRSFTAIARRG
jgi:hypothetical protein